MGGMHGFGPVVCPGSETPDHERWEARVFALSMLTGTERLGDGSGRAIREQMDPEHYLRASYYQRWLWSTERRLENGGAIVPGEVDPWADRLRAGERPPSRRDPELTARTIERIRRTQTLAAASEKRFVEGDRVRVRRMRPAGHTRCPRYVRGAEGVVARVRGADTFPDIGPYQGPMEPVYSVAFRSADLFGPSEEGEWIVLLDLFESYLDAA
jgi:nitrile hydratase beta subunit